MLRATIYWINLLCVVGLAAPASAQVVMRSLAREDAIYGYEMMPRKEKP
jgi:hypothetical protein